MYQQTFKILSLYLLYILFPMTSAREKGE